MSIKFRNRLRGVTLVEVIVATAISAFVLTGLFASLGGIYFSQKKISTAQRFGSESRFLMERVVQSVRNNTLDYDRFFIEVGPSCAAFDVNQVEGGATENTKANREALGYPAILYWDVTGGGGSGEIRNLGGMRPSPTVGADDINDPCAEAWNGALSELYLINRARTVREAIRHNVTTGRIEIQRMLGADTDGDLAIDSWGLASTWDEVNTRCDLFEDAARTLAISAPAYGIDNQKDCEAIYDWVPISPLAVEIAEFEFLPAPNRDPFLNFRVEEAQVHPQVFVKMKSRVRNPEDFGLKHDDEIDMTLQSMASSRVFGNTR